MDTNTLFWICSLVGSGMFVIQFLLTIFGAGANEFAEDITIDSIKFKWLTKQALTGFLLMFGLVGLTCQKEFGLSVFISVVLALMGGVIATVLTGYIFKFAKKLHSPGRVVTLDDALGKEAFVYQRIPKNGIGKISLSLHDLTTEIDAISLDQEDIDSFARVQILKKADENTVVVTSIK